MNTQPINPQDKRVVNGKADINQLMPLKYDWAWEYYLNANKNHWLPTEIPMGPDILDYRSLTPAEKHVYDNVLSYLTTSDILAMRNIGLAIMEKVSAPELQVYMARQVYEECLTDDHEVLTTNGWRGIASIVEGESVYAFDPNTSSAAFEGVSNTVCYPDYNGILHTFENGLISQKVTSSHRMLFIDRHNQYQCKMAEDFPDGLQGVGFVVGAGAYTGDAGLSALEKFLVALQADGTVCKDSGDGAYKYRNDARSGAIRCTFQFSKKRKIDRMCSILSELGWDYSINPSKTPSEHKQRHAIRVSVPLDVTPTKLFGDWIDLSTVSQGWASAFLEELAQWDGWDYRKTTQNSGIGYDTTNSDNAEVVHAVAAMSGLRVTRRDKEDPRGYKTLHRFYFTPSQISRNSVFKTSEHVSGVSVYCITIPSGFFFVRRNGRVSVTGNSLHTWSYQHCIENLSLDQSEIYNRYRVVPEIRRKIELSNRRLAAVLHSDLDLTGKHALHTFAMSYLFFAAIFEGVWFFNGFSPIFSMQRRNKMKSTGEMFQYILRDETMHSSFGLRVINTMLKEENLTLDPIEVREMWDECHDAEEGYIKYILRDPIMGYTVDMHMGQFRYLANRRMHQIGMPDPYPGAEECIPWLDEQAGGTKKEKNFFETRVTEYQTGGSLSWD